MYALEQSKAYKAKVVRFLKKRPNMKVRYERTLYLLSKDPLYPSLRLHKFAAGKYSVSINMSYRISLNLKIEGKRIILLDIGTHREIYGKD